MKNEELQSKTISFLRFPLIVGVVFIHTSYSSIKDLDGYFPIYKIISYLFTDIFSRLAVPLFFFISGFLFFNKTNYFTVKVYWQKLKKRARTILVPYLFWNLLVLALTFLAKAFFSGMKSKSIYDYTVSDWLWTFWDTKMIYSPTNENYIGDPICFQFWFLRDLMVVILFSPLVYFILKKLQQYAVACLGILWLFNCWFNVAGLSIASLFFFSAGAYFSIYRKNFIEVMKPFLPVATVLYTLFTVVELYSIGQAWCDYIHRINILAGIVFAISLSAHFIEKNKWKANPFLSDSSFFIYAYHGIFLIFVIHFLLNIIQPHSDVIILALYIFCPIIIVLVGLFLYYILRKYLPGITAVITGGR